MERKLGLVSRLLEKPLNLDVTTSEELAALVRGSRATWSGVNVSSKAANEVAAWFASNRAIGEDIGKLPFILYETGEQRLRATDNPFWRIVHDRVHGRWSSQQFREYMTFWASQDGDAFALKDPPTRPNGISAVRTMVPFRRGECTAEELADGEFVYHVMIDGRGETLGRRHIFHLQGFAMNTDSGASLFKLSREDIALSLAMERHGATFFGNGAQPGGMMTHPSTLSDKAYDRLQVSMREEFTGGNAHSPLLAEEGLAWTQFGTDNEKSQFLEGRKFQVGEHGRRVRVPPHKIGDLERATFSNIEHQSIEYVVDSLLPWALRWENAYNQQVLGGTSTVYAELLFDMLLRGDSAARGEFYSKAIDHGWMTQNEARRRENQPPLPGGDVLLTPLNTATPLDRELAQVSKRATSASTLVRAGYDPVAVLETVGLPAMKWVGVPANVSSLERVTEAASA